MGKYGWYFVGFCAVFIVIFAAMKFVSNMRVQAEAELLCEHIFNWNWPGVNWQSNAKVTGVEIVSRGDNDAVVKLTAKQEASVYKPGETLDISSRRSETDDCTATVTLYKLNNKWMIGSVEL
jgi:hypothetical protein